MTLQIGTTPPNFEAETTEVALGARKRNVSAPKDLLQVIARSTACSSIVFSGESPCLPKPDHGKHATIAASFGQRPSRELGTLVVNQQQVEEAINGQCNTAGRAGSVGPFGNHRI